MSNSFYKYYQKTPEERMEILLKEGYIEENKPVNLSSNISNVMVENYLFNYELPLAVALNFEVDGEKVLVPMAIEEPSVVAAASNGAKTIGNIKTEIKEKNIIGQVVLTDVEDIDKACQIIKDNEAFLLEKASEKTQSMIKRGGGPKRVWAEGFSDPDKFVSVYFSVDTCDAMGANTINTILESISESIEQLISAKSLMRIISNNATDSVIKAYAKIPLTNLSEDIEDAKQIAKRIELATRFANLDRYRAATHNKGIMNGIDAVVLATGNDWRAIESAAHTYASRDGQYKSLTSWLYDDKEEVLNGKIEIPLPVATVGGTISVHPIAKWSHNLMKNPNAKRLASIIASVGLAQNFSAVRAIVTDGIQKGHMSLHARSLARQVGAKDSEIEKVVTELKKQSKMNTNVTKDILLKIRNND